MELTMIIQEVIGFVGSLIVLLSFTLDGEKRIRRMGIFACIVFAIYGIMITSPSIIFMNLAVFFVHIWKLHKLKKEKKF